MNRAIAAGVVVAGVAIAVLAVLAAGVVVTLVALAAVAPDIKPEIRANSQNESRLYEDGSYIYNVGNLSIVGCAPVHPWNDRLVTGWCMDGGSSALGYFKRGAWVWAIGVDSPWEDFAPEPIAGFLYWFIETFIKSRYQNH